MFKYFWLFLPFVILILMMTAILHVAVQADKRTIKYDCSIAEISPDFPIQVKEACRKKLSGRI
jgi:hypothetical protein